MIKNFVTKPLFTFSIFIVLLLIGIYSYTRLSLDLLPNISIPTLTIITPYPGASPDDIEMTVTKVIEDSVATVSNIDKIISNSMENISIITIQFKWGTNLDAASADIRDKMDLVKGQLPDDVQPSTIYKFDLSQIPILVVGLSADESYKNLYHIADKTISNELKRVEGVGTVTIAGGLKRQINVDIDRERLNAYNLSMNQVNATLQTANLNLPAGSIKTGQVEYGIRLPGEFSSVNQIPQVIVGSYLGKDVYLSDVAEVKDDFVDPDSITEVDKKQGVTMVILKQSGANSVMVADAVKKQLEQFKPNLPPDIKITYVQDTSESIKMSIEDLMQTLYWAFFFVFITVFFFLRNIRGSVIIALAIPASILAAFIFMFFIGSSINLISLASIVISVGVVVDDAVVVIENIYRHLDQKKEHPREAAIFGTGEVAGAVLASTTTNLVIFLPLLLVQGFISIFFNQLSVITIVIIAMSYITSMSLTPMLSSQFLKVRAGEDTSKGLLGNIYKRSEQGFEFVEAQYRKVLEWALNNRRKVVTFSVALFFLSMPLFFFTGTEFFPDQDDGQLSFNINMPAGTRIEETSSYMKKLQDGIIKGVPELEFVMTVAGQTSGMSTSKTGANYGKVYLKIIPVEKRKRSEQEVSMQVTGIAQGIPGLKSIDVPQTGANAIAGSGRPIQIELYGDDFDELDGIAAGIKDKIDNVPGVVEPELSREKSSPEYGLEVDRQKASDLGLSVAEIAMAARSFMYGTKATKYREAGDQYDIFTRLKLENRKSYEDLKDITVTNRLGQSVPLLNLVDIKMQNAPQVVQRKNQQRYMVVDADYYGRSIGDITNDIKKILNKMTFPSDVTVRIAGNTEEMQKSFNSLFFSLLLGLALIYLVMVAQFESFFDPFIIMFAIPFAIVGVIWSLFLTGNAFSVMSFIGMILVMGIAVKNSIVLIDFTNILRERGLELREAILEAGKTRLRPILMTSSCTILGFMPIILSRGSGAGFWKNMATCMMGGLLVSMTITLVFVPVLYYILENRLRQSGRKQEAK